MTVFENITSHLSREDFATMQLYFHRDNTNITQKTDEEIAKLFLSEESMLGEFGYDFGVVKSFLESKSLQCTFSTRAALADELQVSDYVRARMEHLSGNKDIAIELYQKALDSDTQQEHPHIIIEYANFLTENAKYDKALPIYNVVVNGPAKEWGLLAQTKLWHLYYATKEYKKAEECYLQATTSKNIATKQEAHASLGGLYLQVKNNQIQL